MREPHGTASAPTIEQRVEELQQRVAVLEDIKAELARWIGEAKRYERLYRDADERAKRWFAELRALREDGDERVDELTRVLDVVWEASRRVWPLVRAGDTEAARSALDHVAELATKKKLDAPPSEAIA